MKKDQQFEWTVVRYVKFYLSLPAKAAESRRRAHELGYSWSSTPEYFMYFCVLTVGNLVFLATATLHPFPANLVVPFIVVGMMFFFDFFLLIGDKKLEDSSDD